MGCANNSIHAILIINVFDQATAIACGGHHTSALLIEHDSSEARRSFESAASSNIHVRHALFTFGRNFHGQLGSPDFEDRLTPVSISLGFRPCQVGHFVHVNPDS